MIQTFGRSFLYCLLSSIKLITTFILASYVKHNNQLCNNNNQIISILQCNNYSYNNECIEIYSVDLRKDTCQGTDIYSECIKSITKISGSVQWNLLFNHLENKKE